MDRKELEYVFQSSCGELIGRVWSSDTVGKKFSFNLRCISEGAWVTVRDFDSVFRKYCKELTFKENRTSFAIEGKFGMVTQATLIDINILKREKINLPPSGAGKSTEVLILEGESSAVALDTHSSKDRQVYSLNIISDAIASLFTQPLTWTESSEYKIELDNEIEGIENLVIYRAGEKRFGIFENINIVTGGIQLDLTNPRTVIDSISMGENIAKLFEFLVQNRFKTPQLHYETSSSLMYNLSDGTPSGSIKRRAPVFVPEWLARVNEPVMAHECCFKFDGANSAHVLKEIFTKFFEDEVFLSNMLRTWRLVDEYESLLTKIYPILPALEKLAKRRKFRDDGFDPVQSSPSKRKEMENMRLGDALKHCVNHYEVFGYDFDPDRVDTIKKFRNHLLHGDPIDEFGNQIPWREIWVLFNLLLYSEFGLSPEYGNPLQRSLQPY